MKFRPQAFSISPIFNIDILLFYFEFMSEKSLNSEKTISICNDKISHEVLKIFSL